MNSLKRRFSNNTGLQNEEPPIFSKQKIHPERGRPTKTQDYIEQKENTKPHYSNKFNDQKPQNNKKFQFKTKRPLIDLMQNLKKTFSFSLKDGAPTKSYQERPAERKKMAKFLGVRRHLIPQIHFLTNYGHLSDKVIYVGASPGKHLNNFNF
jgi:hypothetical protein